MIQELFSVSVTFPADTFGVAYNELCVRTTFIYYLLQTYNSIPPIDKNQISLV